MPGWDTGTLRFEATERKGRNPLTLPRFHYSLATAGARATKIARCDVRWAAILPPIRQLFLHLSIHLSIDSFIHLLTRSPFIYSSIHVSIHSCIHPFIYLPILHSSSILYLSTCHPPFTPHFPSIQMIMRASSSWGRLCTNSVPTMTTELLLLPLPT